MKKQYNRYELQDDYYLGFTNKNERFYIDAEDYEKIKNYCWRTDKQGYIVSRSDKGKGHSLVYLHRLIMGRNQCLEIDHIDRQKNNNRKNNLRWVTKSQNQWNKANYKNNKSGFNGVIWNKERNKWQAQIKYKNKQIYLGIFDSIKDAIKARKEANKKYYEGIRYEEN